MGAANSTGGVMGKMIDAQSIVVASTATRQAGQEAAIFKGVFVHSIAARVPWSCWPMLTCSPRPFHDGSEVRVSHR